LPPQCTLPAQRSSPPFAYLAFVPRNHHARVKLLVTDLDGTLLDRKGQVSARNLEAIRRLQDAGVEVVPATGRSLPECGYVLDHINHTGHAITAGGALVHDARDGSVVIRRTLPAAVVRGVARVLAEHGHLAHLLQDHTEAGVDYVMVGDQPFDPATEWWFNHLPVQYRRVRTIDEHHADEHTVRVGTVALGSVLAPVAAEVDRLFGDVVAAQHWSALTAEQAVGSETHLLETFARNVNKWTAIESICATYGVDPAETAAVGDGLNDLEMIRHAGFGIAMENADPRIVAVAKGRAGHHDRSGFADAADLVLKLNG
jgi:HAD superfamily hydrolase (TIGR01484 family)